MKRIRECIWLWGHEPGSHSGDEWGLPQLSRISPVEAAFYMGIQNLIMVRYKQDPLPPDRQYLVPFRRLRRVVWSLVGAGGTYQDDAIDNACHVAQQLPNVCGVMMDDFFDAKRSDIGTLSVDELREIRHQLSCAEKPLDLWVVLYNHQLNLPLHPYLSLCDKVTFWTWGAAQLKEHETLFNRFEQCVPDSRRRILGCYMWDYETKSPMPLQQMQTQCEHGLQWLKEGRIEGMIFLASCICDLDLSAVEWTRKWLEEVGDQSIENAQ